METQDQNQPAQPAPMTLNRHQRRRMHALARQQGRASGKAPSSRNHPPARPGADSGPPDPRLLLLEQLTKWAVEGLNEDGTFLAFLAAFGNGHAIVVLDQMEHNKAVKVVRKAVSGKVPRGFIGMMLPTIKDGKINIAAERNSMRVDDMEKAVQIVSQAVIKKFNKFKESQSHDATSRADEQPAATSPTLPAGPAADGGDVDAGSDAGAEPEPGADPADPGKVEG